MSQEPWNDEIYNSDEKSRRNRTGKGSVATRIFTVLAVLFVIIIIAITSIAIYLSSGGSNTDSTKEFYNTSTSAAAESSSSEEASSTAASEESSSSETSTSSSEAASEDGSTLTVQSGEGEASIAARAGISIAELERLNPEKMTTGSWLAHPGDTVRIK